MEFKEATDRLLAERVTLDEIADACGVSKNLISRARMEGEGSRSAPPKWRGALSGLARQRSSALWDLAEAIDEGSRA